MSEVRGEMRRFYHLSGRDARRPYEPACRCRHATCPATPGDVERPISILDAAGPLALAFPGEVAHARDNDNVALMVVSGIVLTKHADGTVTASGGELRVIDPWAIADDGELTPTGYGYRLR